MGKDAQADASQHDLRRSFVTTLLEKGEDLSTVAKAARHASVSTTSIYDRRDEKRVAEAVAKLVVPFGR
jgi:integrase/recombinase XerD